MNILFSLLNKIFKNSVALDGHPEPDLVHATGCKKPTLRLIHNGFLHFFCLCPSGIPGKHLAKMFSV
jgi:hypothetical protein